MKFLGLNGYVIKVIDRLEKLFPSLECFSSVIIADKKSLCPHPWDCASWSLKSIVSSIPNSFILCIISLVCSIMLNPPINEIAHLPAEDDLVGVVFSLSLFLYSDF